MPIVETSLVVLVLWAVIGYLLGSVPSGVLLARVMGLGNLREIGSGNIGATNVLRTGNKKAAALTLLFDAGKGVLAVLLARWMAGDAAAQVAALAAFIGHCFPVWLGFRGGKGVATYLGILWALAPILGAIACGIWLLTAVLSRYSSLSALMAAGWMPVIVGFIGAGHYGLLLLALAVLIYVRHWPNIQRLRAGTESKIGKKKEG